MIEDPEAHQRAVVPARGPEVLDLTQALRDTGTSQLRRACQGFAHEASNVVAADFDGTGRRIRSLPGELRSNPVVVGDRVGVLPATETVAPVGHRVAEDQAGVGDVPERDDQLFEIGSNTSRLISVERDYDPYSGIPRMSGIPVAVERLEGKLSVSGATAK